MMMMHAIRTQNFGFSKLQCSYLIRIVPLSLNFSSETRRNLDKSEFAVQYGCWESQQLYMKVFIRHFRHDMLKTCCYVTLDWLIS